MPENAQSSHPNQAAGKKPRERTPNEANRHEQSEVPTPIKTLTHGGCLNEARSAERVPPWVLKSDF